MPNTKGTAVLSRIRYVRERHGQAGLDLLLAALDKDVRALLEPLPLPQSWVPFRVFIALNVVADKLFGKGDLTLCQEMGRFGASVNLPTIYKLFYKVGSPEFLIPRAAALWSSNYDSGHLAVERHVDGRFILHISDFAEPHEAHCLSVLGWAAGSVELSGKRVIDVRNIHCRGRGGNRCEMALNYR